jgi:tellurite resistance protein TerC
MDVPFWLWAATIAAVLGLLVFDFFAHVRKAHEPTLKESATWSVVYIVIALVFGVGVGVFSNWTFGGEYFAGYVTEKALSVDNLFVFLIIMSSFAVPRAFQQKVLLVGIAIALVMRGIFIAMGSAIIDNFSWVFYLFGALLLVMAYKQMKETHDEDESDSKLIRVLRRFIPTSDHYDGDKLTTRVDGKRLFTPMFLVMLAIGLTDVLFALDSIPAIFGLTQEAYIVFTANAFALLGLRQLYFLISGLLERLVYLSQGLAVILGFIAVKLVLHAMHVNEVPFINGGEPMLWAPEIPIWFSLSFILLTITVATIASLAKTKRDGTAVEGRRGRRRGPGIRPQRRRGRPAPLALPRTTTTPAPGSGGGRRRVRRRTLSSGAAEVPGVRSDHGIQIPRQLRLQDLRDHLRQLAHPRIAGRERHRDRVREGRARGGDHHVRHRGRLRQHQGGDRARRGAQGRATCLDRDLH